MFMIGYLLVPSTRFSNVFSVSNAKPKTRRDNSEETPSFSHVFTHEGRLTDTTTLTTLVDKKESLHTELEVTKEFGHVWTLLKEDSSE